MKSLQEDAQTIFSEDTFNNNLDKDINVTNHSNSTDTVDEILNQNITSVCNEPIDPTNPLNMFWAWL